MPDAVLPLTWVPTRGNEIPPLAVPLSEGPDGQLYIARGLLWGDMHIGTTSHTSSTGARLQDKYGRTHVVFEYEVLTCASHIRFVLESPLVTPAAESTWTTPRRPAHQDIEQVQSVDTPPPRTPGKLAPFSWLSPRVMPRILNDIFNRVLPNEMRGKRREVDPPPYTRPKDGWIEAPKRPSPMSLNRRESVQFEHLTQSKCFTLIDDTASMQSSWSQTRAALTGVVDILSSESEWGGLDIRFLHHGETHPCVRTTAEFERIFNSVPTWRGEKTMAAKVSQIFAESLSLIQETPNPKPVVLLIITDGMAADAQAFLDVIIGICQKLNGKSIPAHMFRIHMLQMGEDRKAVKPLHDFRDRITQRDRERRILNVVSFHRGRGLLNARSIVKLLLGSTYVPAEEDPELEDRKSAGVIDAQFRAVESIRTMGRK